MDSLDMIMPFEKHICKKADGLRIPIGGTIELLPTCNMDCKMCYVRMSPEQLKNTGRLLTVDEWTNIIQQARQQGLLFLLLTGGEPFLYKGFNELYEKIHKMGIVTCINTNGTLITQETADFLARALPRRVNISIYGASDDKYKMLCNNPSGFSQMMHAVHLLKERNIDVKWNFSVTKQNVSDIEKIYRLSEENGIPVETAYYMFPPARKKDGMRNSDEIWLSSEEAAKVRILSEIFALSEERFIDKCKVMKSLQSKELIIEKKSFTGSFTCRSGTSTFWVNWKGELIPCGMLGVNGINVLEKGFLHAWDYTKEWVKTFAHPLKCAECMYETVCVRCAAASYSEEKDFTKNPEYVCELMKHYIENLDKITDINSLRSWKEKVHDEFGAS